MTVEANIENAGVYINALDDTYPAGGDDLVEGDNHVRGIKNTLLNTFANITGAVTSSHTELNILDGCTSSTSELNLLTGKSLASADDVIDNFPAGTLMLFQQTAAPTGWTKETTHNNKALRVVSGTASSGGNSSFTTTFGSGKTTDSHTLLASQIPAHTHGIRLSGGTGTSSTLAPGQSDSGVDQASSANIGGGGGHTHPLTNFDLQYVDIIIAAKN